MVSESATEIVAILSDAADTAHLPRQLVVACAYAESRLNPLARRPSDPSKYALYWAPPDPFDISGGLGQKIVRYMAPYLDWCAANGHDPNVYPGDAVIGDMLDLLNDPHEAARIMCDDLAAKWRVYSPSMERTLAAYNWPAGGGAFYSPAHEDNYRNGLKAAANILGVQPVPTTPLPYNPDAPIDVQPDDFSCSIQSTEFLLRSIGRNPGDAWIAAQLVPGIVSPAVGLKDGSGKALCDWLNREYGAEMGFTAGYADVTFDDVKAGAGVNPTIVGGHNYGPGGHWVGIRRVLPDGSLELANPAPNYTNTGPSIDRAEWDARGPWSAVFIDRLAMGAATPPVVPPVVVPPAPTIDKAAIAARLRGFLAMIDDHAASEREELTAILAMVDG